MHGISYKTRAIRRLLLLGVSGDEKRHLITPIFIDDSLYPRELPDVETFVSFNEANIDHYYHREILGETSPEEKTTAEILKGCSDTPTKCYGRVD